MKARILTLLFLCCAAFCFAQQLSPEAKAFFNLSDSLSKAKNEARDKKDYKKAEKLTWDALNAFNKLTKEVSSELNSDLVIGSLYYDIACYQSLQKKKKEANQSFLLAFESGWVKYKHACEDSDLDNIRKEKKYLDVMKKMREEGDFSYILKKASAYCPTTATDTLPIFTYMNPNDSNLVRIRQTYNLDSIAGAGDEISKIKNLLAWVHDVVRHDGSSYNPKVKNTIAMIELCKKENRGINCRMMAQVLNECYLAMGFKSRFVTCMPKKMISDCHVINVVYSNTLDKWLWVDPTFNAYVTDEKGNMLGIADVRERLRTDQPLVLNEDANWNHKNKQTKEHYLDYYMSKNLYYVVCKTHSEYDAETTWKGQISYVSLVPEGFSTPDDHSGHKTCNDAYFWQSPYK